MKLHERHNEPSAHVQGPPSGNPDGGNLERVRQAGEHFFQAADDAIHRALSGNSLAFLQATRQEGGQ